MRVGAPHDTKDALVALESGLKQVSFNLPVWSSFACLSASLLVAFCVTDFETLESGLVCYICLVSSPVFSCYSLTAAATFHSNFQRLSHHQTLCIAAAAITHYQLSHHFSSTFSFCSLSLISFASLCFSTSIPPGHFQSTTDRKIYKRSTPIFTASPRN